MQNFFNYQLLEEQVILPFTACSAIFETTVADLGGFRGSNEPLFLGNSKFYTPQIVCNLNQFYTYTINYLKLSEVFITLCMYTQQGYVFGCISLCAYMYMCVYMYVNKKTGCLVPYRLKISC